MYRDSDASMLAAAIGTIAVTVKRDEKEED